MKEELKKKHIESKNKYDEEIGKLFKSGKPEQNENELLIT